MEGEQSEPGLVRAVPQPQISPATAGRARQTPSSSLRAHPDPQAPRRHTLTPCEPRRGHGREPGLWRRGVRCLAEPCGRAASVWASLPGAHTAQPPGTAPEGSSSGSCDLCPYPSPRRTSAALAGPSLTPSSSLPQDCQCCHPALPRRGCHPQRVLRGRRCPRCWAWAQHPDQGLGWQPVEQQGLLLSSAHVVEPRGRTNRASGGSLACRGLLSGEPAERSQTTNTADSSGCQLQVVRSDEVPETARRPLAGSC